MAGMGIERYAKREYWTEEYAPTEEELTSLYAWLRKQPAPARLEQIVRRLLEDRLRAVLDLGDAKLYSPERQHDEYRVGDAIAVFLLEGSAGRYSLKRGRVSRTQSSTVFIELVGESIERRFVCGEYLPDFIGSRAAAGTSDSRPQFMSSSSILEECGTAVCSAVHRRLADDDRFVGHGGIWFDDSRLYVVREEHVDMVIRTLCRSTSGLTTDALAEAVAAEEESRMDLAIWSLSLATRMRDDVYERFVDSARGDSTAWTLAPPPPRGAST